MPVRRDLVAIGHLEPDGEIAGSRGWVTLQHSYLRAGATNGGGGPYLIWSGVNAFWCAPDWASSKPAQIQKTEQQGGQAVMGRYAEAFQQSLTDPEGFWGAAVQGIDWYQQPTVILDKSDPPFYRWFADGVLNTCFNAVDRHVRDGRGDQAALIYDSPVTGNGRTLTYRQLLDEVARFAGVLRGLGTGAGDRVVIYMPMIPEAVVAMLACARI